MLDIHVHNSIRRYEKEYSNGSECCFLNLQAPKSGAKHLLHSRRWSVRVPAPRAAEQATSITIDEASLNERRLSAAQAASTPDSTHHKEVRGATETARQTYNIVFVTAEVISSFIHPMLMKFCKGDCWSLGASPRPV